MSTTNILLGTTSFLVFVALILSFGKFTKESGSEDAQRERIALEEELLRLEQERELLRRSSYQQVAPYAVSAPAAPASTLAPVVVETPVAETEEVSDETAAQIALLQEQLAETERKNEVLEKETSMVHERETANAQRAQKAEKRVRIALLMGTVESVNMEYGFITFSAKNGLTFQQGQELGIRRGSGILGRVEVSSVQGDEYSATVKPNAYAGGLPPVQVGDELIRLPDNYKEPISDQ